MADYGTLIRVKERYDANNHWIVEKIYDKDGVICIHVYTFNKDKTDHSHEEYRKKGNEPVKYKLWHGFWEKKDWTGEKHAYLYDFVLSLDNNGIIGAMNLMTKEELINFRELLISKNDINEKVKKYEK